MSRITSLMVFMVLLMCFLLIETVSAQMRSLREYPEVAFAKDGSGEPVLFHAVWYEDELKKFIISDRDSTLIIQCGNEATVYDITTLDLQRTLKIKSGETVRFLTKDGYFTHKEDTGVLDNEWQPRYYDMDGRLIWKSGKSNVMFGINSRTAVCEKGLLGGSFVARDITTGNELWSKRLTSKSHFLWSCSHNDPMYPEFAYMIGDSLICLNVRTGETLSRPFRAAPDKYTGLKFHLVMDSPVKPDLRREMSNSANMLHTATGMHSNWIARGDSLFIADADSLYCIAHDLRTHWAVPLPEMAGSLSSIALHEDKILMLNYGLLVKDLNFEKQGAPFAAAYSVVDGNVSAMIKPEFSKQVKDGLYTTDGCLYLQSGKDFYYCDEDGGVPVKLDWKPQTVYSTSPQQKDFAICDTVYVRKNGILEPVVSGRNQLVVEIYGKDVNVIDEEGHVRLVPADEVFFHDKRDIYSNNGNPDGTRTFIAADADTRRILCTAKLKKFMDQDSFGNIYIHTQQGFGFLEASKLNSLGSASAQLMEP